MYDIIQMPLNFNPRSREGSDMVLFRTCKVHRSDFNPRSREGSDAVVAVPAESVDLISIHAPARGATESDEVDGTLISISIHAPARGATDDKVYEMQTPVIFQSTLPRGERLKTHMDITKTYYFNPRSREGSDGNGMVTHLREEIISIHAPARGATRICIKR
mgnify:CR=1 FL=1